MTILGVKQAGVMPFLHGVLNKVFRIEKFKNLFIHARHESPSHVMRVFWHCAG